MRPVYVALGAAIVVSATLTARDARAQDAVLPEERMADAAGPPIELTPEQEQRARALDSRLKCPVCRSQSIRQSRSFMAEDMKRRIRELIAEGRTDEEIIDYFVARYEEWVLLTPPKRGFSLTAYILPFVALVLGVAVLVSVARGRRRGGRAAVEAPPASPYLRELEKELEETE